MGSFNHNLHVKCDDADRVAAAIDQLLQKQHWRPTDQPPDEAESRFGAACNRRAILVSEPVFGWTSVLDSDVAGEMQLANDLAERLNAYSLFCLVVGSDSWGYALARGDGLLGSFGLDEIEAPPSTPVVISEADIQKAKESLEKFSAAMSDGTLLARIQTIQDEIVAQGPPKIQSLHERIKRNEASIHERARFATWIRANNQFVERYQQLLRKLLDNPEFVFPPTPKKKRKRKPTKAQLAAARERIDQLRPLFVTEVTDDQVQELFDRKTTFAETTLAEFFPLFGIPSFYAYLDYQHHAEATPEELAAHSIRFIHHLKYETDF